MRRKPGAIIGVEQSILAAGARLQAKAGEFHGYSLAKEMRDAEQARRLVSHGTLYKALDRLENAGLVTSSWEDAETAFAHGRPRRRLYRLTASGLVALAQIERSSAGRPLTLRENALPG
jgi:DNA-binding PadR family transcriptional regulator